jgi:hypothetical protein
LPDKSFRTYTIFSKINLFSLKNSVCGTSLPYRHCHAGKVLPLAGKGWGAEGALYGRGLGRVGIGENYTQYERNMTWLSILYSGDGSF